MDLSKYRDLFSAECQRLLGTVESKLSDPEALRADAQAVFRAFHTLKGMSATMNVPAMVLVAHALEEVCHRVAPPPPAVWDGRIVRAWRALLDVPTQPASLIVSV